ncbi:MAG: hypothetical protein II705_05565, partial [Clostridia bacterium]|nr:hypothetical protein [Clostridia bacterium]
IVRKSPEIVSVKRDGDNIKITLKCNDKDAVLYCASYREDGRMTAVKAADVIADGAEHTYDLSPNVKDSGYVKVFLLDKNSCPLCECVMEPLS